MNATESNASSRTRGPADAPRPDFTQLIQALWLQAMIACGKVLNPVTRKYDSDLRLAQYHIGLLEVIEAKTAGNLEDAEQRILTDLLDQARMAFVDVVGRQAVASAPQPKPEAAESAENAAAGDAMENEGSPAPEETQP